MAEGELLLKGKPKRVSTYLLDQGGPLFTLDQRRWIVQLAERPLRLYDVTEVIPGKQMTLCDALDTAALPIVVRERSGSQAALLGTRAGFRIMQVNDHYEISGAAYPFSLLVGPHVVEALRETMDRLDKRRSERPRALSSIILRHWLAQYFAPMPMPTLMDAYSGEPILLITDHYRVKDWEALLTSR